MVLQAIGGLVRRCARRSDVCGRVGGEEFLVVCPDETSSGAAAQADRIRLAIAERPFVAEERTISLTISLGVAALRPAHRSPDALVAEADRLLYAAKNHGRNQVWYADAEGQAHRYVPADGDAVPARLV